jgi:hypothetical protein
MQKVLLKLTLFCAAHLAVFGYFEYRLPEALGKKKALFEARAGGIAGLVLGSSQSAFGVDPDQFSRPVYNLSYVSQDFYYDARLLEQYLEACPELRLVMLEVGYSSFQYIMEASGEAYRTVTYHRLYRIPGPKGWLATEPKRLSFMAALGTRSSIRYAAAGFRGENLPSPDVLEPNGWEPQKCNAARLIARTGKKTMAQHQALMRAENVDENLAICRRLITALKARGVEVVFYSPPVHREYSSCFVAAQYEQLQKMTQGLCAEFGITYLNYFFDARFGEADYRDTNHLCRQGAVKFSQILDQDLRRRYAWWAAND